MPTPASDDIVRALLGQPAGPFDHLTAIVDAVRDDEASTASVSPTSALIDLSFCMGTALMVGHERDKSGVDYPSPWEQALAA